MRTLMLSTDPQSPLAAMLAMCGPGADGELRLCTPRGLGPEGRTAADAAGEDRRWLPLESDESADPDVVEDQGETPADGCVLAAAVARLHLRYPFEALVVWQAGGPPVAELRRAVADLGAALLTLGPAAMPPGLLAALSLEPWPAPDPGAGPGAGPGPDTAAPNPPEDRPLPARLDARALRQITGGIGLAAQEALLAWSEGGKDTVLEAQYRPLPPGVGYALQATGRRMALLVPQAAPAEAATLLVRAAPALVAAGHLVVIRPELGDPARALGLHAAVQDRLAPFADSMVWCLDTEGAAEAPVDLIALIAAADLVVSDGGAAGLSALMLGRPVVLGGPAAYAGDALAPPLSTALAPGFDRAGMQATADQLRRFLLDAHLIPQAIALDRGRLIDRIATLIRAERDSDSRTATPLRQAAAMFAAFGPAAAQARADRLSSTAQTGAAGRTSVTAPPLDRLIERLPAGSLHVVPGMTPRSTGLLLRNLLMLSDHRQGEALVGWVEAQWADPSLKRLLVSDLELFDTAHYAADAAKRGRPLSPGSDPLADFIRHGEAALCNPGPELSLRSYVSARPEPPGTAQPAEPVRAAPLLSLLREVIRQNAGIGLPDWALNPQEAADWDRLSAQLATLARQPAAGGGTTGVVVHLEAADLAGPLLEVLARVPQPFDLFVSLPPWGMAPIVAAIRATYPEAVFCPCPQRGGDTLPFVALLPVLIARGYGAVLKLHGLHGIRRAETMTIAHGTAIRRMALATLGQDPGAVRRAFAEDPTLMLAGPAPLWLTAAAGDGGRDAMASRTAQRTAERAGLGPLVRPGPALHGGFYWLRPACLADIALTGLTPDLFGPGQASTPYAFARTVALTLTRIAAQAGRVALLDPHGATPPAPGTARTARDPAGLAAALAPWNARAVAQGPAISGAPISGAVSGVGPVGSDAPEAANGPEPAQPDRPNRIGASA